MALSKILGEANLTAEQMDTSAQVTLESVDGGFAITAVHLTLKGKVPGATPAQFVELANKAKAGCPVSKLLKADISLDAQLVRIRSQTTYYVLTRIKGICKVYLDRQRRAVA